MFARKKEIELLKREFFKVREELSEVKYELIKAQNPYKWNIGDKVGRWLITERQYKRELREIGLYRGLTTIGNKCYTLVNMENGQTDNWEDEKDVPEYFIK
jgi:hypothetical protein